MGFLAYRTPRSAESPADCIALALVVVTRTEGCPFLLLREIPSGTPFRVLPVRLDPYVRGRSGECCARRGSEQLSVDRETQGNMRSGRNGLVTRRYISSVCSCFTLSRPHPRTPLSDLYPQLQCSTAVNAPLHPRRRQSTLCNDLSHCRDARRSSRN